VRYVVRPYTSRNAYCGTIGLQVCFDCLKLHMIYWLTSSASMYIHRRFFARAILDHPENPMRSAFAPSFLAAYRSASSMIKYVLYHFERFPDLCSRVWSGWTICEKFMSSSQVLWPCFFVLLVFPAAVRGFIWSIMTIAYVYLRLSLAVLLCNPLRQAWHPMRSSNLELFMTCLKKAQTNLVVRETV
jgi:hypothetical protein